MSLPIYKVTSKVATEMLTKELKRRQKYMKQLTKSANKEFPDVIAIPYRHDTFDNTIHPYGVIFKDKPNIDFSLWKKHDDVHFYEGKWRNVYSPKRNSKKGKELSNKLFDLIPSEGFFKDQKILDKLGYKPKSKVIELGDCKVQFTSFKPGWVKKGKEYIFIFQGYPGYKPVRGVKEMLISEHNKLFNEK